MRSFPLNTQQVICGAWCSMVQWFSFRKKSWVSGEIWVFLLGKKDVQLCQLFDLHILNFLGVLVAFSQYCGIREVRA